MQKSNKRKYLIGALAVLLVAVVVGGTVAWLTAANKVTNTFTVGEITQPDPGDKPQGGDDENGKLSGNIYEIFKQDQEIYPGKTVTKKPWIGVGKDSKPSYVFAYVDNKMMAEQTENGHTPYFTLNNNWVAVDGYATAYTGEGAVSGKTYTEGLFMYAGNDGANAIILNPDGTNAAWTDYIFDNVIVPDGAVADEFIENGSMDVWCYLYAAVDEAASDNGAAALEAAKAWSKSPADIQGTATPAQP